MNCKQLCSATTVESEAKTFASYKWYIPQKTKSGNKNICI